MDPGLVRVYYAGKKDAEIDFASQLTVEKLMSESNFSADAVTRDKGGLKPDDKANWMMLALPKSLENGRHMFVWTWAPLKDQFAGGWRDRFTTCFDVFVEGKTGGGPDNTPKPKPKPKVDPAGIEENCKKTCFRGGMKNAPCEGANCPPCRFGNDCYEYLNGACPAWPGGFDCLKQAPA